MKQKKELGQHWLFDEDSLQAMCDIASVGPSDEILEIGPGLGTLTEKLVMKAKHVTAVEFDKDLARKLPGKINSAKLSVFNQDILKFDLTKQPKDYKVIANIPYYLTSNLVRVLSDSSNPPQSVTILIQKEVALRLAAKPGAMSILSVTAQMYFEPSLGRIVPAGLFEPPPKVDSQIIHLVHRRIPLYGAQDPKKLFRIVKAGFNNRRKTLLNSLSAGLLISKDEASLLLEKTAIESRKRPQELSLEDWIRLSSNINFKR